MVGEPLFAEGSTWYATNDDIFEAREASMNSECIESSCYYDDIGYWRCPECIPESTVFSWFTFSKINITLGQIARFEQIISHSNGKRLN